MTDSNTPTSAPAAPTAPARAPSFTEKRTAQDSAGAPAPQPSSTPSPRSQHGERWQDGRSAESVAVRRYEAAEAERTGITRQHGDQPQPGQPSAPGGQERVKIGPYEVSEAELGELISAKAQRDSQIASRPTSPDQYKVELPTDFRLPQGMDFKLDEQNPIFAQARAVMHDIDQGRISGQAAFSKLLGLYAGSMVNDVQKFEAWRAKEVENLGPTGQARVTAVQTFLKGQVGDELARAMNPMLVTSRIVEGFEALMGRFSGQGGGAFSQAHRVAPDQAGTIPGYDQMSFAQRRRAGRATAALINGRDPHMPPLRRRG
jgi:hypothetical protein